MAYIFIIVLIFIVAVLKDSGETGISAWILGILIILLVIAILGNITSDLYPY